MRCPGIAGGAEDRCQLLPMAPPSSSLRTLLKKIGRYLLPFLCGGELQRLRRLTLVDRPSTRNEPVSGTAVGDLRLISLQPHSLQL